ncbi:HPP family protein, partial [Methylobacterium trifolii]
MRLHLRRLVPEPTPLSLRERVRSAAGALIGILATGLISRAALGAEAALPAMIAPMGASAVLLFVVPASPLAQPWSILGGNLVAALVGVS